MKNTLKQPIDKSVVHNHQVIGEFRDKILDYLENDHKRNFPEVQETAILAAVLDTKCASYPKIDNDEYFEVLTKKIIEIVESQEENEPNFTKFYQILPS